MRALALVVLAAACKIPDEHFTPLGGGDDIDAPADTACWSIDPSNFDPCELPAAAAAVAVTKSSALDTTAATLTDLTTGTSKPLGDPYTFGSTTYLLVHVASLSIADTVDLHVLGTRPLLVVSETTIDIAGTIEFPAAMGPADADCIATATPNNKVAPGGTGGGYGFTGGTGGNAGAQAATPMAPNGNDTLVPLRFGCGGLAGGNGNSIMGGAGGRAGGAIELSARDEVTVTGELATGGGGGLAGDGSIGGVYGGGGGGGSGGSILIEAPAITLANAKLCAVGGGGGSGGVNVGAQPGDQASGCTVGAGGTVGSFGGDGGTTIGGAAEKMANGGGGGGGGGSAGRISLHGTVGTSGTIVELPVAMTR